MKLNGKKAVFFDFDDTLQSRAGAYRMYCDNFLDRFFPNLSEEEKLRKMDEMEEHVDGGYKSREEYWPEMIDLWGWDSAPELPVLVEDFNSRFGLKVDMLPGAVDTLKELKSRGYILGMITNGNSLLQNTKLDSAGIRPLFDVVVVSDDIDIWKPEAGIFQYAMDKVGVTPSESVYVGDHPVNDIQGAINSNMQPVRINYGSFEGVDLGDMPILKSVTELLDLLD